MAFAADGDTLVVGADDGPALFYATDPDAVADRLCRESAGLADVAESELAPYQAGVAYHAVCPG